MATEEVGAVEGVVREGLPEARTEEGVVTKGPYPTDARPQAHGLGAQKCRSNVKA